ncbi:13E12 repeat-containing protein, partial [Mycobacterium tuberculosis T85]
MPCSADHEGVGGVHRSDLLGDSGRKPGRCGAVGGVGGVVRLSVVALRGPRGVGDGHHGGGGRRGGGGVADQFRVWRPAGCGMRGPMRERLPKTAEVFSGGDIGYLIVCHDVYRTDLIV